MKKITKREVFFFFIGIFTMLMIESVLDWDNTVNAFKKGWNSVDLKAEKEQVK
jgi:hypothetical protein